MAERWDNPARVDSEISVALEALEAARRDVCMALRLSPSARRHHDR